MVLAKKEVILSGGVFGSPSILQRSGIGRKKLLESLKVGILKIYVFETIFRIILRALFFV